MKHKEKSKHDEKGLDKDDKPKKAKKSKKKKA